MRVLHTPENIAGQASIIAKAQREYGIVADVLVFNQNKFNYNCDIDLSGKSKGIRYFIRTLNFIKCLFKYDIFHFHFGNSLLPYNVDLPLLKLFGKKIVMHYWGDDVRQSDIAINYVYFKTLEELQKIYPKKNDNIIRKNIKKVLKYINISIVGDYSLLSYSPKSIVIKQAIDLSDFPFVGCRSDTGRLKIVHSPSDRIIKGTKYVLEAIEKLKKEYIFDFILVENISNKEASEIYKAADIIIDQLLFESHGVLAVECMALGKPVLCRIDEKIMKYYNGIPVLNTNPENLYDNLKLLLENPELRIELGKRGRKYVKEVHDSKKIAQQLIHIYEGL